MQEDVTPNDSKIVKNAVGLVVSAFESAVCSLIEVQ